MHHPYLQRCCDLANLAGADVSPNPRVGAVLVYGERVIGEGYHRQYGGAHAEVNCLASVTPEDRDLISQATLYVSLEPCCIHGRTPPCTDLIIRHRIPRVVIGQRDQTATVSGQGVAQLKAAGVEVTELADFLPARRVVAARQLFAAQQRPFYLLKYALSADGFLAPLPAREYWITSSISRRLVHFWRSRTKAILVGAGTILADDPRLDTRLYPGPSPLAVIVDPKGRIQTSEYRVFHRPDGLKPLLLQPVGSPVLEEAEQLFLDFPEFPGTGALRDDARNSRSSKVIDLAKSSPPSTNDQPTDDQRLFQIAARQLTSSVSKALYARNVNHATVEGGGWLLRVFLAAQEWDEARVFTAPGEFFRAGIPMSYPPGMLNQRIKVASDELRQFFPVRPD